MVISQATRRLVGGLFALSDLGPQRLKGFGEPLAAWRVEGESHVEGRFDALHGERLTPLVGREHELGILLERWAWAKHGDGQVVLLAGEPGIGKSRLIRALRERLGDEMYAPLSHYCSPYHTNSALHPVIGLLEREARLDRDQPPLEQLARIEALVGRSSDGLDVPLLAALLGVPTGDRYPPLTLTPDTQKRRTLQALVDQLAGLAAQQPVLSLYEDVHWIDPSTLELLTLVIERIRQLPVLLLLAFRPQFQPPWTGQAHVTTLTMNRLGRRQGADLVARVTGDKSLPAEIVDQIVARTDGVPLFIEELTKTVLDSGLLADAGDHYELSGPLPPLAIPTTLHDSLMARLDRLAPIKEVAQFGAVIGREFSHELLAAVAPMARDLLDEALEQLVQSELVFRRGTPPDAIYSFKHALVQDAAYQSLLRSRREQLHGRIAAVLEERFLEAGDAQPELVAHHCTEAGLCEKAVEYWYQAGRRASERAALAEAISHFGKALDLLGSFREPSARMQREIDLQIALGGVLIAAKGYAAPETGRAYSRAGELCREVGDLDRLLPLLFGQWVFHMARAEHAAAREIAAEALRSAEWDGDAASLVVGHRAVGIGSLWRGDLVCARAHLEQAHALYDPERHRSLASVYAYDPRLAGLAGLAFALFQLGYPEQAIARCCEAVDDAERLSHPAGLAYALHHACMLDQVRRDGPGVRERAAALVSLSAEHGFALWQAAGIVLDGWALAEGGRAVEGIARIEDGLEAYRATGARLFVPYFLGLLGTTHRAAGEGPAGERLLAEALDAGRASDERWFEAELYRLKGELRLAGGDRAAAEACFLSAIAFARERNAKLWELRATTSLARLWADGGKRAEASSLLVPVYGWFTEGFDSPDLRDAKALLDELT